MFVIVINELTKHIQNQIPWCASLSDDVIFVDKSRESVNLKLERWRNTLEDKGFKLSVVKMKYLNCNSSDKTYRNEKGLSIDDIEIGRSRTPYYVNSILQDERSLSKNSQIGLRQVG